MTDTPLPRLDPERLRAERSDVDLGDTENTFDRVHTPDDTAQPPTAPLEPTAGINPPAR